MGLALIGLVILGLALVAFIMLGANIIRRRARHRPTLRPRTQRLGYSEVKSKLVTFRRHRYNCEELFFSFLFYCGDGIMCALILPTAALVVGLVVTTTSACLWDTDTLAMERQKFPEALELITGQFLRHSPEFYRWRVEDRQKRIATEPDRIELYDDLAVAYDKLGEHEKAIETILAKEKLKPGLYETYANLGTFYIHNGQLEEGLKHIDKAIEINPDAHFGREKYQRMLVEYVLTKRSRGVAGLPLADSSTGDFVNYVDFAGFIWSKRREKKDSSTETDYDPQAAIKGVLGMMKFGKHDSPILLEALGDLLSGSSEHARNNWQLVRTSRRHMKSTIPKPRRSTERKQEMLLRVKLRPAAARMTGHARIICHWKIWKSGSTSS